MNQSPYSNHTKNNWYSVTEDLINKHPLKEDDMVDIVLSAWNDIFETSIGKNGFKIGIDIFPKPQVVGALMHELIPAEISARFPRIWRGEEKAEDKDIVHIPDDRFSIELKTSSNKNSIFGNRSYAQAPTTSKKGKDGYYIAVNFEKFSKSNPKPNINIIRFGWLDHTDWIAQTAASGQQARLAPETYELKFKTLYDKP